MRSERGPHQARVPRQVQRHQALRLFRVPPEPLQTDAREPQRQRAPHHDFRAPSPRVPRETYQPIHLPTYPPTHLPTYPPTDLPTCRPTDLPTFQPTDLTIYQPTHLPTYQPTNLSAYQPIDQPTDLTIDQSTKLRTDQPGAACVDGFNHRRFQVWHMSVESPFSALAGCHVPQPGFDDISKVLCHYRLSFLSFDMQCTDSMLVFPSRSCGHWSLYSFPSFPLALLGGG